MKRSFTVLIMTLLVSVLFLNAQDNRNLEREKEKNVNLGKRTALVIGNGDYLTARKLPNPVNDASDMTAALTDLGFEVISGSNLDLKQMREKVREFGDKLKTNGGVGLFYYAGHGVQVNGRNYLIPVEADIPREDEIGDYSFSLEQVFNKMATANNGFNIVILDACRNNPFARSWTRDLSEGGLAQVTAPTGTFIAYATDANRTASDGTGRNGIYTSELLKIIKQPNLKIEETFKEIQKAVRDVSNGKQIPWVASSFSGDFYFKYEKPVPNKTSPAMGAQEVPKSSGFHPLAFSGSEKFKKGDYDGAISDFKYAIELDASHAADYRYGLTKVYFQRGSSRFEQGNYEGALTDMNSAIETSPTPDAVIFNYRGIVRAALKKYDEAISDYNKAIEIDPNLAVSYANRGDLYKKRGDKTKADLDYQSAKKLDQTVYTPGSKPDKDPQIVATVNLLIASANEETNEGRLDAAIIDLTQAINLIPKKASLYILRGNAKLLKGYLGGFAVDYPAATRLGATSLDGDNFKFLLANTTKAIELNPKNVTAILNRSLLYFAHGECGKGNKDIKLAISTDPNSYTAKMFDIFFSPEFASDKKGLEKLNRIIELDPKSSFAYFIRAEIYSEMGKKEESQADLAKLLELSQEDNVVVNVFLRRSLQEIGGKNAFDRMTEVFVCMGT